MQQPTNKQIASSTGSPGQTSLQLLLFVDRRPGSKEQVQRVRQYLQTLKADYPFELQIIDVSDQPYLAEHFKLVATPALVKIYPEPRHILAGSDLVAQLQNWWSRWQIHAEQQSQYLDSTSPANYSAEVIQLSDEVFRLQREKEQLLEQLHFKDQVLAMLAHDLRSPLTAASIAVETLELAQNKLSLEQAQKLKDQLYRQARSQFKTMNRMITDILQASSDSSAQLRLKLHKLTLQKLCQEIISQFKDRCQEKSLKIEADLPQDLPDVYADEELIRQVLVNLLENALKYTPEKGKIHLSVLHRTTQKIQVSICDTGPGIPEEKRDLIFEGRFRLERDEATEGYGIGLSLCQKVIQAHYGHIWVDSAANQGSCFHFTLPVYQ